MHKRQVQNYEIQDEQEESRVGADAEGYIMLTDYLAFDQRKNLGAVVSKEKQKSGTIGDAKKAVLEYKICGVHEDKVMFDILLHTGRHHQIRLQMANAGYPLVGDQKYGESQGKEQLALCSYFIEFEHPETKKRMSFSIKPKNELFRGVMCEQ